MSQGHLIDCGFAAADFFQAYKPLEDWSSVAFFYFAWAEAHATPCYLLIWDAVCFGDTLFEETDTVAEAL